MVPLNAPLPTAWNLPFQPEVGNHTSILISESLVGFSVAATRQNADRLRCACALRALGGVKPPASTDCAIVIVAFGRDSFDNASHDPAASSVRPGMSAARTIALSPPI